MFTNLTNAPKRRCVVWIPIDILVIETIADIIRSTTSICMKAICGQRYLACSVIIP